MGSSIEMAYRYGGYGYPTAALSDTPVSLARCVSRTSSRRRRISLEHVVNCTATSALPKPLRLRLQRSSSRTSAMLKCALQKLLSNQGEQQLQSRSMLVPWKSTDSAKQRQRLLQLQLLMPRLCSSELLRQHSVQRRPATQRWQLQRRKHKKLARQNQL